MVVNQALAAWTEAGYPADAPSSFHNAYGRQPPVAQTQVAYQSEYGSYLTSRVEQRVLTPKKVTRSRKNKYRSVHPSEVPGSSTINPNPWEVGEEGITMSALPAPKWIPNQYGVPKPVGNIRSTFAANSNFGPQRETQRTQRWWRPFVVPLSRTIGAVATFILTPSEIADGTLTDQQWREQQVPGPWELPEVTFDPVPNFIPHSPITPKYPGYITPYRGGFDFMPKPNQFPRPVLPVIPTEAVPLEIQAPMPEWVPRQRTRADEAETELRVAHKVRTRTDVQIEFYPNGQLKVRPALGFRGKPKRVRDTKNRTSVAMALVNQTFGNLSEAKDFVDALVWNVFDKDGVRLFPRLGYAGTLKAVAIGYGFLDLEAAAYTLMIEKAMDYGYGKFSQTLNQRMYEAGWSTDHVGVQGMLPNF